MSHTCKGNRWLRTALIEARRVLEPEWSALSVVEREEFIRLFGDRLLWGYLSIVRDKLPASHGRSAAGSWPATSSIAARSRNRA